MEQHNRSGCFGWSLAIMLGCYAYFWPFIMLPGKPAEWFIGVPWLITALALTGWGLAARAKRRQTPYQRVAKIAQLNASLDTLGDELTAFGDELHAVKRARELHQTWPDDAEAMAAAKRIYATYGDALGLAPDEIYSWITAPDKTADTGDRHENRMAYPAPRPVQRRRHGLAVQAPRGYHGTLPGWKCPHNHSREDLAVDCANREARRRPAARPAPAPWPQQAAAR